MHPPRTATGGGGTRARAVGPNLSEIRQIQEANNRREWYDTGHLERVRLFETAEHLSFGSKQHCSKYHGAGCTECTTCHFCRQKTIDRKTFCSCCGTGCGIWCGSCLYNRMGEDISKVLPKCASGEWSCPVCRDVCNCSGETCLRKSRGWEPTSVLHFEARRYGYKSAAHYLILTALDTTRPPSTGNMPVCRSRLLRLPRAQPGAPRPGRAASDRLARAQQELSSMQEASRAAFAVTQGDVLQQVARECNLGCNVLDTRDDEEPQQDEPTVQPQQQQQPATMLSPTGGMAGARMPVPLFSWAGGSTAGAAGPHQQQQRSRSAGGAHNSAAAAGMPATGVNQSPAAAAAAAGAGTAAAELADLLGLLGLDLPAEQLGVLAINSCGAATQPVTPQVPDAGAASVHQHGTAATAADAPRGTGSSAELPGRSHQQQLGRAAGAVTSGTSQQARQQPEQQQQRRPAGQQQQQQHQQQPAATPMRQASAAVEEFGPDDLPGASAPGYRSEPENHHGAVSRYCPRRRRTGAQPAGRQHASAMGSNGFSAAAGAMAAAGGSAGGGPSSARAQAYCSAAAAADVSADVAAEAPAARSSDGAGDGGPKGVADMDLDSFCDTFLAAQQGPPAGTDAVDEQAAKRPRLSHPADPSAAPGEQRSAGSGGGSGCGPLVQFEASPASSPLDQAEYLQADLELELAAAGDQAVGPEGVLYDELCERLEEVVRLACTGFNQSQLPAGAIKREGALPAHVCSLDTLRRVCKLLVFVAQLSPPQDGRDPSYDDLIRRLSNQEPFVDFASSGIDARAELVSTAAQLLEALYERQHHWPAIQEAWVASGARQLSGAGYDSVVQLTRGALHAMQLAQQAMAQVVECLLEWMAVLQQETVEATGLIEGEAALLLAPQRLGPVHWDSAEAMRKGEWAGLSEAEKQVEQDSLRDARRVQLHALLEGNATLLTNIANTFTRSPWMTSGLAAQVLAAEAVPQLLDLEVRHPVEARMAFVLMVGRLLKRAAPDLQQPGAWQVDVMAMRAQLGALASQPGQLQQLLQEPPPTDSLQLHRQADLLLSKLSRQLDPAARQQQLAELCSSVEQQLLGRLEALVDAEYPYRNQAGQRPDTSKWLMYSQRMGSIKVDVLGALYALQLRAGSRSWTDIEGCLAQPAQKLQVFFRLPGYQLQHRRFVLYLTTQVVNAAPSLLRWDVPADTRPPPQRPQQQCRQSGGASSRGAEGILPSWQQPDPPRPSAASSAPGHVDSAGLAPGPAGVPAVTMLRLWLRTLLDQHPPTACAKSMEHVTHALRAAPATAALFERWSPQLWQAGRLTQLLQGDCGTQHAGSVRAQLALRVLMTVRDSQGVKALADVLDSLHKDLYDKGVMQQGPATKGPQDQLFSRTPKCGVQYASVSVAQVLRWERSCLLTVLKVAELVLQHPQLKAAVPLTELVGIASSWMMDGIKAVCGLQQHSSDLASPSGSSGGGSGSSRQSWCVKSTALQHLANYLGLLVRLASQPAQSGAVFATGWLAGPSGSHTPSQPHRQAALCCLRDLLGTALQYLSAEDTLQGQHAALLNHLAGALAQQSGLLGGQQEQQQLSYCAPGLLHHVLSTHVHAVLKDAANSGAPDKAHMAVNTLHLVKQLFAQLLQPQAASAEQQQTTQQLLLPCLANPLLDVLRSEQVGRLRVQMHAYTLLQQLLVGRLGQQLLPQTPPGNVGGPASLRPGRLSRMEPITGQELSDIFYRLMQLSLHTVLLTTAEAAAQQQQQQQAQLAPAAAQQQHILRQQELVRETDLLLLRLLGCPTAVVQEAKAYPVPDRGQARLQAPAPAKLTPAAETRQRARAITTGLAFVTELQQQGGVAQQEVSQLLPSLLAPLHMLLLLPGGFEPAVWGRVKQGFNRLVGTLTQEEQQRWHVPAAPAHMPPPPPVGPQQQQQQQQRGLPRQQQGQQQQQAAPRGVQQQRMPANGKAAECATSQACSRAGGQGRASQHAAAAAAGWASHGGASQPEPSVAFSQDGGRAASCAWPAGQGPGTTAAAARQQRKRGPGGSQGGAARQEQEEVEAGDCGTSSISSGPLHKKARVDEAAAGHQQKQQVAEVPDICSQDQGPGQEGSGPEPLQAQCQQPPAVEGQPAEQQRARTSPPGQATGSAGQQQQEELERRRHKQQRSRSKSSSGGTGNRFTVGGYVIHVQQRSPQPGAPAPAPAPAPVLYLCLSACAKEPDMRIALKHAAAIGSYKTLSAGGCLGAGAEVVVTKLRRQEQRQAIPMRLKSSEDSELLVNPSTAAAAGLPCTEQQQSVFQHNWSKLQERARQFGENGGSSQREAGEHQQQQQQQQPGPVGVQPPLPRAAATAATAAAQTPLSLRPPPVGGRQQGQQQRPAALPAQSQADSQATIKYATQSTLM